MNRPGAVLLVSLLAALAAPGGCLPPVGTGPLPLPAGDTEATLRAGLRYAGHPERHAVQVQAVASLPVTDWFTLDIAGLYTAQRDPRLYPWQADDPAELKHSGFPVVRPTFHIGPLTVAVAASAFFAVGPQAGAAFGYGALTVGWATPAWAAYAGVSGHAFTYLTDHREPTGGTWQVAIGGQHRWIVAGGLLLGVDAELGYLDQTYTDHGPTDERTRRALTGTIGFELGWAPAQ